jgi:hypothetical protein
MTISSSSSASSASVSENAASRHLLKVQLIHADLDLSSDSALLLSPLRVDLRHVPSASVLRRHL